VRPISEQVTDFHAYATTPGYLKLRDNSADRNEGLAGGSGLRTGGTSECRSSAPRFEVRWTKMSTKVTCAEIDDLITSGPVNLLSRDAEEHMGRCKQCSDLVRMLQKADEAPLPVESQVERIQAMIAALLEPVRPLAPARSFLGACAIIFLSVVAIGITQSGMDGWAALNGMQRIAVFATMATSAALLAVSVIGQMAPGDKYALAPTPLPIGVLTVLIMMLAVTFRPQAEPAFVESGLACVRRGLTYSVLAASLFWLLLRRGAILYPKLIGAAAGGLAGLAGFSVLQLNCPDVNVFHIMVWHWGVILIGTASGALIGAAAEYIQQRRHAKTF
jgi:hypothetical protein